jgi:hypothetical protein
MSLPPFVAASLRITIVLVVFSMLGGGIYGALVTREAMNGLLRGGLAGGLIAAIRAA